MDIFKTFKVKRRLVMIVIGAILLSILVGFAAIGAANGISNLAKTSSGEANWSVIWAIIVLHIAGLIDILIGFGAVIIGGLLVIGRLEKDTVRDT